MQDMLGLGTWWLAVVGVLAAAGLWLFVSGMVRFFRGRFLRGPLRGAFGAAIGAFAVALAAVGMNLHTYHRLNYEEPVAVVEFRQLGPQHYEALLRTADGEDRAFEVHGDEWQLDARVLKWKGAGALLGLDPRYRLERFSGRYAAVNDERHAARSIYGLSDGEKGVDVWQLSQEYDRWLPFVDTVYGSAAYMPMRDGARYRVLMTEDGLIARRDS
ncbi:MAG TPA: cation/multidrug efflux pump [Gammaproteobacteria bacterium]